MIVKKTLPQRALNAPGASLAHNSPGPQSNAQTHKLALLASAQKPPPAPALFSVSLGEGPGSEPMVDANPGVESWSSWSFPPLPAPRSSETN